MVFLHRYGREVPLSWLKLADRMSESVEQGSYRVSLGQFRTLASECMIDDEDELSLLLQVWCGRWIH